MNEMRITVNELYAEVGVRNDRTPAHVVGLIVLLK